jgi:thiol-disulfide isomerase/thioredoxin
MSMSSLRFSRVVTLVALAVLAASVAAGCGPKQDRAASAEAAHGGTPAAAPAEAPAAPAPEGEKPWAAPQFELEKVGGGTVRLADLRGKVVLVDFWATWCPPCKKEIPHLVALYGRYRGKGLEVVGIADDPNDRSKVGPFVSSHGIPYPVVFSTEKTAESFGGLVGYPTVFVIDRAGQVVGKFIGYTDERNLELAIQKLL